MKRQCLSVIITGALAVASAISPAATATPATDTPQPAGTGRRVTPAPTSAAPAGLTAAAQASGAMPNIDSCVARLDPQLDIGYDRIAARCPDLMTQLETGAWASWLPRGWKEPGNDLSAGSLKELRELVDRESGTRETNPATAPNVHSLRPILTALAGSRLVALQILAAFRPGAPRATNR